MREPEETPRQTAVSGPVIGEDLSSLSIEELEKRIVILKSEISRLEQAIVAKNASRLAADQFFKR